MAGVKGKRGGARRGSGQKPGEATLRVRGSAWMATRARILERDGYLCRCERCAVSESPAIAEEVDHVVPLSQGGADADENLQALNSYCHKLKSAREAEKRAAEKYTTPATAHDSLEFLRGVMQDMSQAAPLRVRAAIALAQYEHPKVAESGKKEAKQAAAKAVSERFSIPAGPKLKLVH